MSLRTLLFLQKDDEELILEDDNSSIRIDMKCSLCKKTFYGTYWTLDNKEYCSACYEKVRLKCDVCHDNIDGEYFNKDGKVNCKYCYEQTRLKCDICHNNIDGTFFTNFKNNICKRCDKKYDNCDVCNRYISHLTDGGYSLSDNRKICSICNKSEVKDKDLKNHLLNVSSFMISIGLNVYMNTEMAIKLVSKKELDDSKGRCNSSSKTINGKVVEQNFIIEILYGLPEIAFKGILAHELFHMWVKMNTNDKLSKYKEEGIANLCQYLYLLKINNYSKDKDELLLSSYLINNLLDNKDKNYGDGFRKAKEIYEDKGINGIFQYIK